MDEEILKRLGETEAQAAALRRACIQAKKKEEEELNVYHELEEERTQIPCEPSYAQVLLDRALSSDAGCELLERLRTLESAARSALQALTEGMADVPTERDKRCAALRVKAKRALREALGLAPKEENDGDL